MSKKQKPHDHGPNRRKRIFIGKFRSITPTTPTTETEAKAEAFKANHPGTDILYGPDGRVSEIVNHDGLLYKAASPEELMNAVQNDLEIRDPCELDTPGAITNMRYLGSFEEAGNLGTCVESQQVNRNRLVHSAKITIYAINNHDGTWSVWRIVNTTESAPVAASTKLRLSKARAIKAAERATRKALKLTDKTIQCKLAEAEGGYQVQLNRPSRGKSLKPIQRIFLEFVDSEGESLPIPVEVIVDSRGEVVFGRELNCYLQAQGFLIEPSAATPKEAEKELRIYELDESTMRRDQKTGRSMLASDKYKVEVYYDPKDQGNADKILIATPDGGMIHALGTIEQAAVILFTCMTRCERYHVLTGSPPSVTVMKSYVGLKELFREDITNNAAYFPSAGVIGIGLRVGDVLPNGRHSLAIPHVIYHERGHAEDDKNQKEKNRRITGQFWMGVGEHNGDLDAFCFTILDILEFGEQLGIKFTADTFMKNKGALGVLAFSFPIRVMDNEWRYPLDEGDEVHNIGEKVDALSLHTARAWFDSEYKKAITPEMSEVEKNAIARKIAREVAIAMPTIRKSVTRIIKENRPTVLDLYQTYKLVARRNYGAVVESYFHEGYTVKHGVPDSTSRA